MKYLCLLLACVSTLSSADAHAQSGVADVRYTAPMPPRATFTSTDSTSVTITGTPMGDMSTTGVVRSVVELTFSQAGDSVAVQATLLALTGAMNTPAGTMPLELGRQAPIELRLGLAGPDPEAVLQQQSMPATLGGSPAEMMGSQQVLDGLLLLPGRPLQVGETWTDTMVVSPTIEGLKADMQTIVNGTYAGDTLVDGRTLNVLRISSTMTAQMEGTMQGVPMTQHMTTSSVELVLWDSALHLPRYRDVIADMKMESLVQGMAFNMTGRTRSITTAEPGS